jgi:hypothetical protein
MGELVRKCDVGEGDLNVPQLPVTASEGLHLSLMLVQQGDRIDQSEILHVIAPGARTIIQEGQPVGIGVTMARGSSNRCASCWTFRSCSRSARAARPASVRRSRCAAWIAAVCCRPSSIVRSC